MHIVDLIIRILIVLAGLAIISRQSFSAAIPFFITAVGIIVILVGLRFLGVIA